MQVVGTSLKLSLGVLALMAHSIAAAGSTAVICADRTFEVTTDVVASFPMLVKYRLSEKADGKLATRPIYTTTQGDWFFADCAARADGKIWLLFQVFCPGSGCVEDRYGLIDPVNGQPILLPPVENVSNLAAVEKLIGRSPPYLPRSNPQCCQ